VSYSYGRIVAGFFGYPHDALVKEPTEGTVPGQRAMNGRQQLHHRVVALDVRALMRQYRIQLGGLPGAPVAGENDLGAGNA